MSLFDKNPELILQFRLAMDLGKTVNEVRRSMTVWEFLMWNEFYKRERTEVERMHERAKRKR